MFVRGKGLVGDVLGLLLMPVRRAAKKIQSRMTADERGWARQR
jgi:hypothetical protein